MAPSENDKLLLKREVDWLSVIWSIQLLISSLCSLHFVFYEAYLTTTLFSILLILLGMTGLKVGAHRLWAHQSFKANAFLRFFLMLCQTITGQNSIYNWVRLHRLHHKYFQTDLDPYYSPNGFLYSHFICSILKLSPAQEQALKEIDMSDLKNDKIVMFQKRFYWGLFVIIGILLPLNAPMEYWDESFANSVFVPGWLRLGITYHLCVFIYSAFHIFDFNTQNRNSFDSNAVFLINKSYWLSYHYLSPWDYQASEYGKYGNDCVTKFIRVCAALDLATDLKTVDSQTIREALTAVVNNDKPISECIAQFDKSNSDQTYYYLKTCQ